MIYVYRALLISKLAQTYDPDLYNSGDHLFIDNLRGQLQARAQKDCYPLPPPTHSEVADQQRWKNCDCSASADGAYVWTDQNESREFLKRHDVMESKICLCLHGVSKEKIVCDLKWLRIMKYSYSDITHGSWRMLFCLI